MNNAEYTKISHASFTLHNTRVNTVHVTSLPKKNKQLALIIAASVTILNQYKLLF